MVSGIRQVCEAVSDWTWRRLPGRAAGWSPGATALLADGAYLTAWPGVAGFAPIFSLCAGLILGRWHFGYNPDQIVFLYSTFTVALLLLISAHGAALGLLALGGYVVGDLLWALGAPGHIGNSLLIAAARAEADCQLAYVLVLAPVMARTLAKSAAAQFRIPGLRPVVQGLIFGGAALLWSQTAPVMLQAVYIWQGYGPLTHGLVQTTHLTAWIFALVAAYGAGVSAVLEAVADSSASYTAVRRELKASLAGRRTGAGGASALILLVVQAAVSVFMVGALIETWTEAFALFAVIAAILASRRFLFGRLGLLDRFAPPSNPLVRLGLTLVVVYVICDVLLHSLTGWAALGFRPAVISMVLSGLVAAVLAPRASVKARGP